MKTFLRCVRQAWTLSHSNQAYIYKTLLFEDQTAQFRVLAASIIKEEDLKTDLEDILLKTPSGVDARDVFVADGRLK